MRWTEYIPNLKYEIRARNFGREPGRRRTFWRHNLRWNGNIKVYFRETEDMDAIFFPACCTLLTMAFREPIYKPSGSVKAHAFVDQMSNPLASERGLHSMQFRYQQYCSTAWIKTSFLNFVYICKVM